MAVKRTRQPLPDAVFTVVRALARELSMDPMAGSCTCQHIRQAHRNHYGSCTGDHGKCPCQGFKGINWNRVRLFERYGVVLVARLRGTK